MTGALSGHLLTSYSASQPRGPFGQHNNTSFDSPSISTHHAMSFSPQMHGNFPSQPPFSLDSQPSFMDVSQSTADKIERLQAKLNQKLGPEYISQRPGPGGGPKLTYAEGWKIINLANEVFGFNGWSSTVVSLTVDFIDFSEESRRYTIGVTSIIRVTLRDGVFHEDIGYGMLENSKSKGAALDKCKKEAVTDGLKRALRNFGNLLGNCLYDKSYTSEVIKIKVSPPKFDSSELHRRPEFDVSTPNTASTSTATVNAANETPSRQPKASTIMPSVSSPSLRPIKFELQGPNQQLQGPPVKPLSSLPPHMRSEATMSTHNGKCKTSAVANMTSTTVQPSSETIPAHESQQQTRAQPQPERKVSFADMPPRDHAMTDEFGEDSFTLTSEDDAFLAAVDLGEGDLGRPILTDDCMGRPLEFEEGMCGADMIDDENIAENHETHNNVNKAEQVSSCGSVASTSEQQRQRPRSLNSDHHRSANTAFGTSSRILQEQKPPQQPRLIPNSSSNTHSGPGSGPNASRTTSGSARTDQNYNPATNTSSVTPKHPTTPSMGGFHFPSGMNPLAQARSGPPQSLERPSAGGQSSGVGQKRTADSMQSFTRRPLQGMGLAHQFGGGKREPLARLDMGDSADVKRMRL